MNKKLLILIILIFMFSCNKITPENSKNKNETKEDIIYNKIPNSIPEENIKQEGISCGTISCDVKNYLNEKFLDGKNIEGLSIYQERLGILLDMYDNHYDLIESEELKKLTYDLYNQFFGCEGNVYDCPYEFRKTNDDELNYIFYIFIPQMVIKEYVDKRSGKYLYAEDIIQAIKRKDFDSNETKESKIEIYKQKLDDFIKKIDLSLYEKEKLLNDDNYFYEKILKANEGLHDIIMKKSVNPTMITLDWTQEGQLEDITKYTVDKFFNLILDLGITKEIFINKIKKIYGYNENLDILESIKEDIYNKTEKISKKYNLKEKMVYDRYLRYDELYIYNNSNFEKTFKKISGIGNEYQFYIDIGEIGNRVLLLFNLGFENEYYFLPTRLDFYNNNNSFLTTNLYKIFKYADEHNYKPENNIIH